MAPGLLAVHAHADDETITMGGTLAHYASLGVRTANVCCTDGRLATIVDPTMVEEEVRPRLGEVRHAELTEACAILGVGELHWLGYHDSGMVGEPSNREPDSFWMTPLDSIVERLVGIIREFRPDVVVTYDAHGAYGHPDHVQAHRATLLAVEAAQHPRVYPEVGKPWRVSKLYYTAFARSSVLKIIEFSRMAGMESPFGDDPEAVEFGTPDELITARIDCSEQIAIKRRALQAHRSQISADFPLMRVPEEILREHFPTEHYSLALSHVPVNPPEDDLFAGIAG
ncbi:MAG TPA: PIG-L family deacetylase [Candidatus Dormibacteraeota bacterium]|nr:PIG-L family deacetylase [Candidatus Dormibacteraeota bacterium]